MSRLSFAGPATVVETTTHLMRLAFTMTPAQAERIGTRDLSLVGSLDFPPAKK